MNRKRMHRTVAALLTVLLLLGLAACGKAADETTETTQLPQSAGQQESAGQNKPSPAEDKVCSATWLYKADFSAAPLEDYQGSFLPIHAQLPLDLRAMDAQIAPYSYFYFEPQDCMGSGGDKRTATSIEEFMADDTCIRGSDNQFYIREGLDYISGMPHKVDLPLFDRKEGSLSDNLQNNWWYLVETAEKQIPAFLDLEATEDGTPPIDAVLAKFGTPHRIYPLHGSGDTFRAVRAGTLDDGDMVALAYQLVWLFPDCVITIFVNDFAMKNSGDTPYRAQLSLSTANYYPRACWERMNESSDKASEYLEPHIEWGN